LTLPHRCTSTRAEFSQYGSLDPAGSVRLGYARHVNHLNVIGLMPGHHLVTAYSVHDSNKHAAPNDVSGFGLQLRINLRCPNKPAIN